MQAITFTTKTRSLAFGDPVQLAVRHTARWHHLSLLSDTDGWKSIYSVPDEVRSVELALRAKGPAFGEVRVIAKLPSLSVKEVIVLTIPADKAYRQLRETTEVIW